MLGQYFWGFCIVSGRLSAFCATGGGSRRGGVLVSLGTAVPWGDSPSVQGGHGPLHPAVTNPPRLCWFCIWFLLSFSGMDVGYSVWCFWSLGLDLLSGFFALKDLTLVRPDVCGPLSLSLCSVYSSATFFSLSFSLSGAGGKPKPRLGFRFPLVFLLPGRALRPRPVPRAQHIHLGIAPAPVFFFFFSSSSLAGMVAVGCVLVRFLFGLWWWAVACKSIMHYRVSGRG